MQTSYVKACELLREEINNCESCQEWEAMGLSSTCPGHDAAIIEKMKELDDE